MMPVHSAHWRAGEHRPLPSVDDAGTVEVAGGPPGIAQSAR